MSGLLQPLLAAPISTLYLTNILLASGLTAFMRVGLTFDNMADLYPDLTARPIKETICLFDVDGTLTPARQSVSAEMLQTLSKLRHQCAIGFVCRLTAAHVELKTNNLRLADLISSSNKNSSGHPLYQSRPFLTSASPKMGSPHTAWASR